QMFTKPAYALAWLEDNRPGLILASYRMPDMGCEEYIWLCRQIPDRADVPIVVAAAEEDGECRKPLLQAGAVDVIVHPEDSETFLNRARALLAAGVPVSKAQIVTPDLADAQANVETGIIGATEGPQTASVSEAHQQSFTLSALDSIFNNLLTSLSGIAHMELMNPDDRMRVITSLEEISEVSSRAIEITRQMLTISHEQVPSPALVRTGETVRGMQSFSAPSSSKTSS
ncbi:MAG: hypothetical protein O7I42_23770, partial [Alphaproteobacteria bacterium]|nr:hypothetical protein [Alphaproteobacteria bacterium]